MGGEKGGDGGGGDRWGERRVGGGSEVGEWGGRGERCVKGVG